MIYAIEEFYAPWRERFKRCRDSLNQRGHQQIAVSDLAQHRK